MSQQAKLKNSSIETFEESIPPAARPSHIGSDRAVFIQRFIALLVVVLPAAGVLTGLYLALTKGLGWAEIVIFMVMYTLGMLGITLGFHRFFAHRSYKTSGIFAKFLIVLGSISAQGPLLFWVATHRRHHIHSDQPGDPHSPNLHGTQGFGKLKGFLYGHIGWMFTKELTDWKHFVPDLLKNRAYFTVQRFYFIWLFLGLALPTLWGWLWMGSTIGAVKGFLWGGLIRIFCVNHALWFVGSVSHMYGHRPFSAKTRDQSANNWWVALAAFGEGNQNNHHAFPNSAKHGLEWWQPDFTFIIIKVLEKLRIIWDVKIPSRQLITQTRSQPRSFYPEQS